MKAAGKERLPESEVCAKAPGTMPCRSLEVTRCTVEILQTSCTVRNGCKIMIVVAETKGLHEVVCEIDDTAVISHTAPPLVTRISFCHLQGAASTSVFPHRCSTDGLDCCSAHETLLSRPVLVQRKAGCGASVTEGGRPESRVHLHTTDLICQPFHTTFVL